MVGHITITVYVYLPYIIYKRSVVIQCYKSSFIGFPERFLL